MANIVYEHGELLITVPASQKIQVYSRDIAQLYVQAGFPNHPPSYNLLYTTQPEETYTSAAFSVDTIVKINAGAADVLYAVGTNPSIPSTLGTVTGGNAVVANTNGGSVQIAAGSGNGTGLTGSVLFTQGPVGMARTVAAKTVSALLTAAEVKGSIITVNNGTGVATALQLPTAAAMDTAFVDFAVGHTFEFSVVNASVVAAETATLTTNTGWTLVGAMDLPAYSAAGSLNSSAIFWARKTGTGAWTLYRAG